MRPRWKRVAGVYRIEARGSIPSAELKVTPVSWKNDPRRHMCHTFSRSIKEPPVPAPLCSTTTVPIVEVAQKEFRQIFPQPGWVEHDPQEIWATQIAVAIEALGRAQLRPRDVAAIGITNQRETTIVWDRETGQPVVQRDRLAGSPHRGILRPAQSGGPRGAGRGADRARDRRVFFRQQDCLDPGQRARRARSAPKRVDSRSARWIPGWSGS